MTSSTRRLNRLALVGLVALALSFAAGCDTQGTIDESQEAVGTAVDEAGETIDEAGQAAGEAATGAGEALTDAEVVGQAATELDELAERMRSGAEVDTEAAADQVAGIQERLATVFEDAEGQTAETWQEVQVQMAEVEMELRGGGAEALSMLETLIERIRNDLYTLQE